MKNKKTFQAIEQQWDRAIEDAMEKSAHLPELGAENLTEAAGLHVKSGVQSGLWNITPDCSHCTAIC